MGEFALNFDDDDLDLGLDDVELDDDDDIRLEDLGLDDFGLDIANETRRPVASRETPEPTYDLDLDLDLDLADLDEAPPNAGVVETVSVADDYVETEAPKPNDTFDGEDFTFDLDNLETYGNGEVHDEDAYNYDDFNEHEFQSVNGDDFGDPPDHSDLRGVVLGEEGVQGSAYTLGDTVQTVSRISLDTRGSELFASVALGNGRTAELTDGYATWCRSTDKIHEKFEVIEGETGFSYTPTWRDITHVIRFTFMPFGENSRGAHIFTPQLVAQDTPVPPVERKSALHSSVPLRPHPAQQSPAAQRLTHRQRVAQATRALATKKTPQAPMITVGQQREPMISKEDAIELEYRQFLAQNKIYRDVPLSAKAPEADPPPPRIQFRRDENGMVVHARPRPIREPEQLPYIPKSVFDPPANPIPTSSFATPTEIPEHILKLNEERRHTPGPGTYRKDILAPKVGKDEDPIWANSPRRRVMQPGHVHARIDRDIPGPGTYRRDIFRIQDKRDDGLLARSIPVERRH